MASQQDFQAVLDRIDNATNGIADELRSLKDQIQNTGMPAEIEMQVLNSLTAAADKLEGIGKNETLPDDGPEGTEEGALGNGATEGEPS